MWRGLWDVVQIGAVAIAVVVLFSMIAGWFA